MANVVETFLSETADFMQIQIDESKELQVELQTLLLNNQSPNIWRELKGLTLGANTTIVVKKGDE